MKITTLLVAGLLGCSLVGNANAQETAPPATETAAKPVLAPLTPENMDQAIAQYENTRLPRALTPKELKLVTTRIQKGDVFQAGTAARFLANAQDNDVPRRLTPILARFKETVESPLSLPPRGNTYISSEAYALNLFLLSISQIEPQQTVVETLDKEYRAKTSPRLKTWLIAAGGFAGDKRLASSLRGYIETETDGSLKALLVRAYAWSAQEAAIPVLQTLREDQSITAYVNGKPQRGVSFIANDELKRLGAAT